MKGFFITGTDTGVGKTVVASAIAWNLNKRYKVGVFKPVQSGVEDIETSDAGRLYDAIGRRGSLDDVVLYSFWEAVAPSVAAEMEGVDVSLDRIVESYRRLAWESDLVLVEGAGGFLVPISGTAMISDLARVLALPVLIISRPNLGTVNHTLLTIRCVRSMGLEVAGVLINKWDEMAAGNAEHSAEGLIEKFGDVQVLAKLPNVPGKDDGEIILSLALWMEKNFDWGFLEVQAARYIFPP